MKKPFKLRSNGSSFKMMGSSPLKIEGKKLSTLNKVRKGLGLTPQGIVGMGLFEGGLAAAEWMGESWNKAENVKMNAPENAKYAEWYYGPSNKSKNIGKTTQIKKGDKIEATGPENL